MYVCYLHNEKSYLLGWTTRLKLLQGTPYSTYHILVKLRRLGSITGNKYPNHELIVLSRLPAGCRNYLRVILSKINVNRQEIWQIRFINWGLLKLPYSNNLSESSKIQSTDVSFVLDLNEAVPGNRERLRCTHRNWKGFHLRNCFRTHFKWNSLLFGLKAY